VKCFVVQSYITKFENNLRFFYPESKQNRHSGEMVWPMPYLPENYMEEFASVVADSKNSVKNRSNAQSSCAASFIRSHFHGNYKGKWAHVDMASPSHVGERATGYGVGLVASLLGVTTS